MTYACLIRMNGYEEEIAQELDPLSRHFVVHEHLDQVQKGDIVFGRFGLKPFYDQIAQEIRLKGATLLVDEKAHDYIEDLQKWYPDFADVTPQTWFTQKELDDSGYAGPYIVKGKTYSRKHQWDTHCFAQDKKALMEVGKRLREDPLFAEQDLVVREFVPLKTYAKTQSGLPITCEYRYFLLDGKIVSKGYYWASYKDFATDDTVDEKIVKLVAKRLMQKGIRFCVADFALTEAGDTILIELNDPSMTGLSENDPYELYANMYDVLLPKDNQLMAKANTKKRMDLGQGWYLYPYKTPEGDADHVLVYEKGSWAGRRVFEPLLVADKDPKQIAKVRMKKLTSAWDDC